MIGELVTKPGAATAIVVFVTVGVAACLLRLWWLWWTLCECPRCGKPYRDCRGHYADGSDA